MELKSIKVFLQTMRYYNTVNIKQVFAAEGGSGLSVRCVHGTETFELTQLGTEEVTRIESIDHTAGYILAFAKSHEASKHYWLPG